MNDKYTRAAALLWECAETGRFTGDLAADIRPATRADGYAAQAQWPVVANQAVRGWKIAATSQAGREHIGVSGPLAGRILASRVHPDGARIAAFGNGMRVAEPEIAFSMARDLPPRERPYGVDEVLAAVEHVFPCIEVPSSRFADFVRAGEAQLLADNACAGRFVLGAPCADWRPLDLRSHEVRAAVERNGATVLERAGTGEAVLGDPRAALAWLVNEVNRLGITMEAGQFVSTGTCMAPLPIEPGDVVRADYGALGSVGLIFVA